jgi:menaquinone-dependent protoporphyrinogen oxidase
MPTAVIYLSKTGNTRRVAEYIANSIGAQAIDIRDDKDLPSKMKKYDRIILGTGIYAGKPSKAFVEFVKENRNSLEKASLFVTCLYEEKRGAEQLERVATNLGIADAIFFNKARKQMGIHDSKLETYIESLKQ